MGKTNSIDKRIRSMWHQGNSVEKIAESMGITKIKVEKSLKNGGVKMEARKNKNNLNPSSPRFISVSEEKTAPVPSITIDEEAVRYSSTYKNVSEDNLEKIIEALSLPKFNMEQISRDTGVSVLTIKKIRDDLGIGKKFTKKEKKVEEEIKPEPEIVIIPETEEISEGLTCCRRIYPGKYIDTIRVGMVRNRHDMPTCVKEYIFNKVNSEDITNFSKLDSYVSAFILNKVKIKNDLPCKNLEVFATGLQSALGSVVRMCYKYKVNLTLKHYDSVYKKYYDQVIFDDFPIDESELIDFGDIEQIYIHNNMTEEDLLNKEFYGIEVEIGDKKKFKVLHAFMSYEEAKKDYWSRSIPDSDVTEDDFREFKFFKASIVDSKMVQTKFIHRSSNKEF